MNNLPMEYISLLANSAVIIFICYYFLILRTREKELEKKEKKTDSEFHQVIDNALERERKIISDTTEEAEHIITEAKYISSSSKQTLEHTLSKTIEDIQKEAVGMGNKFLEDYSASLSQLSQKSQSDFDKVSKEFEEGLKKQVSDFQSIAKGLEENLQHQIKTFNESLLPQLARELEEYKKERMRQTEEQVTKITEKASREILNKSMTADDHQKLIVDALEKAKKEGVFN